MALDNVLKIYDEQGNPVDYDILASDVKFKDGKDLPAKLDELEQEIGEGGYAPPAGGIPATDLSSDVQESLNLADSSLQPSDKTQLQGAITQLQNALNTLIGSGNVQGVIDTFNEVKAFLDGIDTSDPTLANQLLVLNNAISAVQTLLEAKANAADIPEKVSDLDNDEGYLAAEDFKTVNNTSILGEGNITIPAGESAYDIAVDEGFEGTEAQWLASLKGDKGDQGDTVLISETPQEFAGMIVNDLTTGGGGSALSAEMGKLLKANIVSLFNSLSTLYAKLGNIAFWSAQDKADAAPDALDWQVPKKALTITNNISNSVIEYDGCAVTGSILVDAGETINLLVRGATGYEVASVTASGATIIDNHNGTFTVRVRVINDTTLAISGTTVVVVVVVGITTSNVSGALGLSNTSVQQGGTFVGQVTYLNDDYNSFEIASVKDTSNNDVPYTVNGDTITIANVPSDITITAIAKYQLKVWFGKSLNGFGAMVDDADACCTDFIKLNAYNIDADATITYKFASKCTFPDTQLKQSCVFYDKNRKLKFTNGDWEVVRIPSNLTNNDVNSRAAKSTWFKSVFTKGTDEPLYARFSFKKVSGQNAIESGAGFFQNNVNLVDLTNIKVASTAEAYLQHSITYNLSNVALDNTSANNWSGHPSVQDGQPIEIAIRATSGSISNVAISVVMGGVDITNNVSLVNISDLSKSSVNYKVIRVESVTGDVTINASI